MSYRAQVQTTKADKKEVDDMSKKTFRLPTVLMSGWGGDPEDPIIGGGTGQSGSDPYAMSFSAWLASEFADDCAPVTPGITMEDYGAWWVDSGLTEAQWLEVGNSADDWENFVVPFLPNT